MPRLPQPFPIVRRFLRYNSTSSPARTRFAPSPTGFLHIGSLRTALYNYLLAHSTSGQFLLRIEDTDSKRTVPGALDSILETLEWASLNPSSPHVEQSTRKDLHTHHANLLLQSGHAYRCFCTPSRISALAEIRAKQGLPTDYDRECFSIPTEHSDIRASAGDPFVIRLKAPKRYPDFVDLVYGRIPAGDISHAQASGGFEDPVLLKSDGSPTYHLANVVDDHHMGITHVVRATEWLPSTPKHMFLYKCFGWEPPKWVHVGLLQDKRRRKLSKRSGDVFVSEYREKGYFSEALVNFVALLGWGAGRDGSSEVMTLQEMVKKFNTNRLTAGNTVVDFGKLDFLQKEHLKRLMDEDPEGPKLKEMLEIVARKVTQEFGDKMEDGNDITREYIDRVIKANFQNLVVPGQFVTESAFFFKAPDMDGKPAAKTLKKAKEALTKRDLTVDALMGDFMNKLEAISEEDWKVEKLHPIADQRPDEDRDEFRARMRVARYSLTGGQSGPNIATTMEVLGRVRTMERLAKGIKLAEGEGLSNV